MVSASNPPLLSQTKGQFDPARQNATPVKINKEYLMINTFKTAAISAVLALGMASTAVAQELRFFTIGTGGTAYTY